MKPEVLQLDPLQLAFLGDAVYEVLVRESFVGGNLRVQELHKRCVNYVSANAQCEDLAHLQEFLTEEERELVRRARNRKGHAPKSAKPQVYALSTAFEALLGALYLSGEMERIRELFEEIRRKREWKSSASEEQ